MDEDQESNRTRKLEGRERKRRHQAGSRAFLHAMTNSRSKRFQEQVEKSDKLREEQTPRSH